MKKFLVALCVCFLSGFFVGCQRKEEVNLKSLSKDKNNYQISVDYDVKNKQADVLQTVKYVNSTGTILKNVQFHLYPQYFKQGATQNVVSDIKLANAYSNGMSYAKFEIERVLVNGEDVNIVYEGEFDQTLNVELGFNLMPNNSVEILIEYFFELPNCNHRFGYGENTINLCNFYPIASVWENGKFVETAYNSNGDPFYSDMSNYCVDIAVNNEYLVAGSGSIKYEKQVDNKKNVKFEAEMVRDFALVLSNKFQVKEKRCGDTKILYYYFNDSKSDESLQASFDAIKTFSNLFGEYPYKTFSVVQADFVHGGMEYPALVMISGEIDNSDDYKNVIVHETAHQWWYGIVGNDEFDLPWIDEALTEYSTVLFYDYNKDYNFNHKEMINSAKENFSIFISVYEDVLGKIDTSMRACDEYNTEPEYTYCVYVKGVLMFDSLCQIVGNENFVKSLKYYFDENKFKNVQAEDLIQAFETTCNGKFENFFGSWIKGKVVIR